MPNRIFLVYMIIMTLFGAFGGYSLKRAVDGTFSLIGLLSNRWIWIGGSSYVLAMVMNIIVLKFQPYTIVLPLTAITYIWTLIFSRWLLKEHVGGMKIAGLGLISLGVCLLILCKEGT